MGVVNAGSSPAPALQDSLTGKTSAVLSLQTLVVGFFEFLVRWFYRRTATVYE